MTRKPSSTERGYGAEHRAERAKWEPRVELGGVVCAKHAEGKCLRSNPLIDPAEPWDLGHTDDRSGWSGPEHPECNRSAGGRNGNRVARERAQMVRRGWF